MDKVRLSVSFECTVEVDNDSDAHVQLEDAKQAVEYCLPYRLDGDDFLECNIMGCNNITSEQL